MRRALVLLAGAAFLLTAVAHVALGDRSAAAPAPGGDEVPVSWAVGPPPAEGEPARPNFVLEAEPGDTVRDVLVVENLGEVNLVLGVYASDAFNTASGGIDLLSGDDEPTGLGSWVVVDEPSVTVPAGASVEVPFSIRVPDDAKPGDHVGGIVTSLRITEPDQTGTRVTVERRLGTRIYLRVDGELSPELTFTALSSTYRGTANPFAPGAMDITYRVENTGNVRLRATRTALVEPSIGPSTSGDAADMAELLPGSSYELTQRVDGVWPGWSTVTEVELTPYDSSAASPAGAPPAAIARVSTTLVPWPQIVLLVAAVVVAVLSVLGRRRRDRQLRASVDQAVAAAIVSVQKGQLLSDDRHA
ncbi:MAG: WxL protein peptidoglycan domain-containing protein [Microthrixaceae bacterium]